MSSGIDVHVVNDGQVPRVVPEQVPVEIPCKQRSVGATTDADRFFRMKAQCFYRAVVNPDRSGNTTVCRNAHDVATVTCTIELTFAVRVF